MNRLFSRLQPGIRTMVLAVVGAVPLAGADAERTPAWRVRSENSMIAVLIAQAAERSVTFRREIDVINASDGLIYVEEGRCGRSVFACLVLAVTQAGPYRLLHVKLDLRRSEVDLMAAIGHELQHAIEALSERNVTDDARITSFFEQLGPTGSDRFETPAAIRVGDAVFNELRADTARRQTCSSCTKTSTAGGAPVKNAGTCR